MRTLLKLVGTIIGAGLCLAGTLAALSLPVGMVAGAGSGDPAEISLDSLEQRSYVYSADGSLLTGLHGEFNREVVGLDEVPEHLIDAILAVEDQGFWVHDGVDGRGIVRAFQTNVGEGGVSQGGSTLTQQVVKLSLVGDEQSLERKVQEFVLARRLEKELTKEEILTRYMNVAYFGHGAYGVEAAAETYFGVPASDLDIGQSALLAGMIRNPRFNDPVNYPENAERRRSQALSQMEELGFISSDERVWFSAIPLPEEVQEGVGARADDYFVDEVLQQLLHDEENRFGLGTSTGARQSAIFQGGLRVHTTYDPAAQQAAEAARNEVLPGENGMFEAGDGRRGTGAMISVDPGSGAVRTMVAGPGFERGLEEDDATGEQFNLTTGERQIGSTVKTFVLTEIMEQGHSPLDLVDGTGPCMFDNPDGEPDPYEVPNYGGRRGEVGTIQALTSWSSNCGYMRLALIADYANVAATAERLGIKEASIDAVNLASPLGTSEVSPLEMASSYATLANDGIYNEPYYIERIEGADGRVIYEHDAAPERVIEADTARLVSDVLAYNVTNGTGTRAAVPGQPTAGKTGTTNDHSDVWFVGYTPHLATAAWVGGYGGNFEFTIEGATPSSSQHPASMFGQFMTAYHADLESVPFETPALRPGGEFLQPDPEVDLSGGRRPADRQGEDDGDEDDDGDGDEGDDDSGDGSPRPSVPPPPITPPGSLPQPTIPSPTWPPGPDPDPDPPAPPDPPGPDPDPPDPGD